MLNVSSEFGLMKCILAASGVQMWPKACFVYSDVISLEWSQSEVEVEQLAHTGLMHMTSPCLPLHSNPLGFSSRLRHSIDHLYCWIHRYMMGSSASPSNS